MDDRERSEKMFELMNALLELRKERDSIAIQGFTDETMGRSLSVAMAIDHYKKELEIVKAQ